MIIYKTITKNIEKNKNKKYYLNFFKKKKKNIKKLY